jgi:GT2 family glycosyltransferase
LFSPDEETAVPYPGITVIASGPAGPGYKRDLCAQKAGGEILAFLDDDAYPEEGWLEAAARIFEDPEVGAVGGPGVTPPGDSVARWGSGLVYSSLLAGGPYAYRYFPRAARQVDDYPTCNLLVRRDLFLKIGGFDTKFWPGEDTVACLKIVHEENKKIAYSPDVLVYHHRRDLYAGHLKQVNAYARHRGYFVKRFPQTSLRLSYFIPSLFLLWVAAAWVPALWWRPWAAVYSGSLIFYACCVLVEALRASRLAPPQKRGLALAAYVASGIVITHLSYGWHFVLGLLSGRMGEEERAAVPA